MFDLETVDMIVEAFCEEACTPARLKVELLMAYLEGMAKGSKATATERAEIQNQIKNVIATTYMADRRASEAKP